MKQPGLLKLELQNKIFNLNNNINYSILNLKNILTIYIS